MNRRKEERKILHEGEKILSGRVYNLIIGAVIAYGFAVNALFIKYLTEMILSFDFWVIFSVCVVLGFGGVTLSWKSKNAFLSFVGYNLVVIAMSMIIVQIMQGKSDEVILTAVVLCAVIAVEMIIAAGVFPDIFRRIGILLFCALVCLIIGGAVCWALGLDLTIISVIGAVIFSLYIGYDWLRAQENVKTLDNALDCALDIYLDIIVVFLKLLKILNRNREN